MRLAVPRGSSRETVRRAKRATEGAWRLLDGAGIRFSPFRSPPFPSSRILLAEGELAALLPARDGRAPRPSPPPGILPGLALGRQVDGAPVGLPVDPDQGRHLAIVGETGMGKSSLLVDLATRAARLGGVVILDPLGETAERVRAELSTRTDPVVWIAPGEDPPTLNALEGISPVGGTDPVLAERRIDDIVHALRRVRAGRYSDSSFWGPRLEEMLGRAVRAAAALPGGTLVDAHTLLATMGRTRQVIPPEAREPLRELADRMRERPEDAEGARRLLYDVVRNPTLAGMLCARSPTVTAPQLVAPGSMVVVSGAAARVGESTARYLFAVYLALLWSALLARPTPSKTFVLLDEAQWFAHESLSEMLRLARRLNVHVVVATQSLASLPDGVRDAVWTNVADIVAFRGSPEEARELARVGNGVSPETILALPRGDAMVFVGKGESVHRLRTVRLPASRPHASAPPVSPPGRDGGDRRPPIIPHSSAAPPSSAASSSSGPPPLDRSAVLESLRAEARRTAPDGLVEFSVTGLRSRGGLEGERLLRSLGAELGRAGAIVRTTRGPGGTVWWVDPRRIPANSPGRDDR